jgi:hypothetical protein
MLLIYPQLSSNISIGSCEYDCIALNLPEAIGGNKLEVSRKR